jgi:hypothetical protein
MFNSGLWRDSWLCRNVSIINVSKQWMFQVLSEIINHRGNTNILNYNHHFSYLHIYHKWLNYTINAPFSCELSFMIDWSTNKNKLLLNYHNIISVEIFVIKSKFIWPGTRRRQESVRFRCRSCSHDYDDNDARGRRWKSCHHSRGDYHHQCSLKSSTYSMTRKPNLLIIIVLSDYYWGSQWHFWGRSLEFERVYLYIYF